MLFSQLFIATKLLSYYFQEMYLPTMPQDDLETVKEALLNARTSSGNENPVFYRM